MMRAEQDGAHDAAIRCSEHREQKASTSSCCVHRRPLLSAASGRQQDRQGPLAGAARVMQGIILTCQLFRCVDGGGVGWGRFSSDSGLLTFLGSQRSIIPLSSLAMLVQPRETQAATPLFSSFFPSESCCLKPNFFNENIAPELKRCRQVILLKCADSDFSDEQISVFVDIVTAFSEFIYAS